VLWRKGNVSSVVKRHPQNLNKDENVSVFSLIDQPEHTQNWHDAWNTNGNSKSIYIREVINSVKGKPYLK
jgi:hypothetical protein